MDMEVKADSQCDFCTKYADEILSLPVPKDHSIYICRTCLVQCIKYLDANYCKNFTTKPLKKGE